MNENVIWTIIILTGSLHSSPELSYYEFDDARFGFWDYRGSVRFGSARVRFYSHL